MMRWNEQNDQVWYWHNSYIVSNMDGRVLQGSVSSNGVFQAAHPNNLNTQKWNIKRGPTSYYDHYIVSEENGWYLDIKQNIGVGSTLILVNAAARKDSASWIFEEVSCYLNDDDQTVTISRNQNCDNNNEVVEVSTRETVHSELLLPKPGDFLYSITSAVNGLVLTVVDDEVWTAGFEDTECQKWFIIDSRIVSCNGKVLQVTDTDEAVTLAFYNPGEIKQKWSYQRGQSLENGEEDQLIVSEFNDLRLDSIDSPVGVFKTTGDRIGAKIADEGLDIVTQTWWFEVQTIIENDDRED